jgi:chromosome partitioning protein
VANQKGGVGKTTTAINFGAALAALERRVLLIDCDPQANATRGVGIEPAPPHLYQVLSGEVETIDAIRETEFPYLHSIPSSRDLVGAEVELGAVTDWQSLLRESLQEIRADYDVILLDCPPSLGHLTINALVAADGVLVPLQCEYFALEGISALLGTIDRVRQGLNRRLALMGILRPMVDERTTLARDVAAEVRRHFRGRVFETRIPRNVRLAEAPSHGMPVLQYDVRCAGAAAYLELAREYLRRES